MAVTDNRPFFLNLLKIHLPVTGFVSILHRVSGLLLFLAIPFAVYLLDISLQGVEGFKRVESILSHTWMKLVILVLLWSVLHHLFAGIRFLLTDFEIGLDKAQAIVFAWVVLLAEALVFVAIAYGVLL